MMTQEIYRFVCDLDLSLDESKRLDCPVCNGRKTFTVTNSMGKRLWNCYKASCEVSGSAKVNLSVDDIKNLRSKQEQLKEEFILPEYVVPMKESNFYDEFYGIHARDVLYDVKENRVVSLVKKDGKIVDATGRANGNSLPKWKRYGKSSVPYSHGNGDIGVIVEDCISAYVIGDDMYTGVALLGTSLSEGHKDFITKFNKVVVALDPDALPKTLQIAKELKGWVNSVKVLRLTDDLKYCRNEDINNLKELVWN